MDDDVLKAVDVPGERDASVLFYQRPVAGNARRRDPQADAAAAIVRVADMNGARPVVPRRHETHLANFKAIGRQVRQMGWWSELA